MEYIRKFEKYSRIINIVKQNFGYKKISNKIPFKNRKFLAISRDLSSIFRAWRPRADDRNRGIADSRIGDVLLFFCVIRVFAID